MTRFMEKMFSISSLDPGGARVIISPEAMGDGQIMRFMVSLSPGTKVEVKFQGEHVTGSPYTYHALAPSVQALDEAEATDGLRRMELLHDLERAIADAENNVTSPANNEVARPSAPLVVDLSSDSSDPASARGIDFSGGIRWREVGFIDSRELGGQVGLCLLKNGNLVVSTMVNKVTKKSQVKMFDPQLKLIKKILDKDGQEFKRPGDMTRLYNGDFALKVFHISGIFIISEIILV